jgi:hypothetical protein
MDFRNITRKQFINYGGDIIAVIAAIIAIIQLLLAYMPSDYAAAGTLIVIAGILSRGSTILANLIDYLSNQETA